MLVEDLLGRTVTLPIRRFGPPGAFLAIDPEDKRRDAPTLLLLGSEIPEGAETGDSVEVFVYLDSEGRPIATRRTPKVELDEVAFLEVKALTPFGAFVDWGLAKELLVPFAEQTTELTVGARHPIGVYIDEAKRFVGTMRVSEMLRDKGQFELDEWVEGEAWRSDPAIGLFVIVERAFVGLVPRNEPHTLARGEAGRFRVSNILPDGKIELSLRGHAHEELENDARALLDALGRNASLRIGDKSDPEEIRAAFGLSKKAFKRAAGRLLKQRSIHIDDNGFLRIGAASSRPRR